MGSLANSSSLQTTIQENPLLLSLSAFSQLSLLTLKPSPRLRLMPTTAATVMALPTTGTAMAWLTVVTTVLTLTLMLTDTTTARGPLRPSPRPMPTTVITDMAWPTTGTAMLTMATTATLTLPVATTDIITKLLLFCLKNWGVRYVKWVAPSHTNCY